MLINRAIIALVLGLFVGINLYLDQVFILYQSINIGVLYDTTYMIDFQGINESFAVIFFTSMISFNTLLYCTYLKDPINTIYIIIIVQSSDIFQYIAGKYFGQNKIGWISKNKTLEGYAFGLIATLLIFQPIAKPVDLLLIYTLGAASGLVSSAIKRTIDIKDYSNLLGPHGGWVDRIDSIILPMIVYSLAA